MSSVWTKHWSAEKLWFSVKKALEGAENIIIKQKVGVTAQVRTCVSAECRENTSQWQKTWASAKKDVAMLKKLSHAESNSESLPRKVWVINKCYETIRSVQSNFESV